MKKYIELLKYIYMIFERNFGIIFVITYFMRFRSALFALCMTFCAINNEKLLKYLRGD